MSKHITNSQLPVLSSNFRSVKKVAMRDPVNLGFTTRIDTN